MTDRYQFVSMGLGNPRGLCRRYAVWDTERDVMVLQTDDSRRVQDYCDEENLKLWRQGQRKGA